MKMNALNHALQRIGGGVAAAVLVAGVFGSVPALAATATGIATTKHNLGTTGIAGNNRTVDGSVGATAEVCVFCHTPHGSDTSASVPLWNKVMSTAASYTTYNSLGTSSLDGGTAPVGSVSLACLSCHDGTQAMNVMINGSGSGNYFATGATYGTMEGARQSGGKIIGVADLKADLQNDHPIGIQYAGGPVAGGLVTTGGAGAYTSSSFNDKDFKAASVGSANGQTIWWVDTVDVTTDKGATAVPGTAARQKTDMQLYTRGSPSLTFQGTGGATITAAQPFVECASCHDPHSTNTTFLRIDNTGSAVCLACHIK